MRHAAEKEKPLKPHLTPRHKVWLNWDGLFLMGPNYLRFLAAVDQTGTIREGGRAVGWSYRTCLNRLRRMEQVLGRPVLVTSRGGKTGGGARLTPEARRFVRIFSGWQREVERLSLRAFARAVKGTINR
ncbi:MAG TPA: LysR family transcriptional regulator [Gemmatimonadales bacterium]